MHLSAIDIDFHTEIILGRLANRIAGNDRTGPQGRVLCLLLIDIKTEFFCQGFGHARANGRAGIGLAGVGFGAYFLNACNIRFERSDNLRNIVELIAAVDVEALQGEFRLCTGGCYQG